MGPTPPRSQNGRGGLGLLIVPASCAAIYFARIASRLLASWLIGTISCSAGIAASTLWDLPTGAAVVAALGVAFALAVIGSIFPQGPKQLGVL